MYEEFQDEGRPEPENLGRPTSGGDKDLKDKIIGICKSKLEIWEYFEGDKFRRSNIDVVNDNSLGIAWHDDQNGFSVITLNKGKIIRDGLIVDENCLAQAFFMELGNHKNTQNYMTLEKKVCDPGISEDEFVFGNSENPGKEFYEWEFRQKIIPHFIGVRQIFSGGLMDWPAYRAVFDSDTLQNAHAQGYRTQYADIKSSCKKKKK